MSGPLYVPVLPARRHAAEACERLRPEVRAAVRPLWNLPPLPGAASETLTALVRKYVDPASAASRHGGWIDAPFAEDTQTAALAEALSVYYELGYLSPATGPERSEARQAAAVEAARCFERGLGVRVRVAGEWDSRLGEGVRGLLARCGPAIPVDLLLDMGAVLAGRADAGKEALRALDALLPLVDWQSATLLGGGFPQVTADMLEPGTWDEPRAEWHMWHEVRASERAYAPLLRYGDYGTQSVAALAQAPVTSGGPPWGTLRYTTEDSYLVFKMLTRGPDRVTVNRGAARRVIELPEFRGTGAGQAEQWLSACAHGPSWTGEGTGGPATWLRVGNLQHMTYVVHRLLGP